MLSISKCISAATKRMQRMGDQFSFAQIIGFEIYGGLNGKMGKSMGHGHGGGRIVHDHERRSGANQSMARASSRFITRRGRSLPNMWRWRMSSLELDYLAAKVALLQQTLDAVHKIIIVMDKTDPVTHLGLSWFVTRQGACKKGNHC